MSVVPIPLAGNFVGFNSGTSTGVGNKGIQYFENVVFDVYNNPLAGKVTVYLRPREGAESVAVAGIGSTQAILVWTGNSNKIIIGATPSGTPTVYMDGSSIGTVTGNVKFLTETLVSGIATLIIQTASDKWYYYQPSGSVIEITDSDFPPKQGTPLVTTGRPVFRDGYMLVACTNGQIWNSDVNSVANWTTLNYISAGERADPLVGIANYRQYVAGIGTRSIQFFRNEGNAAGSPFSRTLTVINVGAINEYAFIEVNDTVAFVGGQGSPSVYILNGEQAEKISTPAIDNEIGNMTQPRCFLVASRSKSYLGIGENGGAGRLFSYDFETKNWSVWTFGANVTMIDSTLGPYTLASEQRSMLYLTNAGSAYQRTNYGSTEAGAIQIGPLDFGTPKYKMCKSVSLIGQYLQNPANVKAFSLSYSDDFGTTFNTARTMSIGNSTSNFVVPTLHRLGAFRSRMFKLTWTAGISEEYGWSLQRMDVDVEAAA